MSRLEGNQIRFRGVCINGHLKGKEIEGTIDIDAVQSRKGESSGFGSLVILLLLVLGINVLIVKNGDLGDSHSSEEASQVLEESDSQYFYSDENKLVESTRHRE